MKIKPDINLKLFDETLGPKAENYQLEFQIMLEGGILEGLRWLLGGGGARES